MATVRGAKRFFRIGQEQGSYGTPAAGYSAAAVSGSGNDMRFFRVSGGNFTIHGKPVVEEQPELRGQLGVEFREKTGTTVEGDFSVLAHPESTRWFLDAALARDGTSGDLDSFTIQEFYSGIDATEKGVSYVGCKVNQLTGSWGSDNQNSLTLGLSVIGQREVPYTGSLPSVSGYPTVTAGYFFTNSGLVDLSAHASPASPSLPVCDYTAVNFTIANTLSPGPRCFDADSTIRGAISDLTAGQERLSGGFTLRWKNINVMTWLRAFTDLTLRNLFIHPSSDTSLTFTATQAVSSTQVTVAVSGNPTTLFSGVGSSAPYVIAIQHGGATPTNWSTAVVTAVATGPNTITLENVDVAIASGDIIWTRAMEIRFDRVNLTDVTKQGGPDDAVVTVQGTFEGKASSGTSSQITYRTQGAALPTT